MSTCDAIGCAGWEGSAHDLGPTVVCDACWRRLGRPEDAAGKRRARGIIRTIRLDDDVADAARREKAS